MRRLALRAMQSGEDLVCGLQGPYGILAVTKPAELLVCLLSVGGLGLRSRSKPSNQREPYLNLTLTQPNLRGCTDSPLPNHMTNEQTELDCGFRGDVTEFLEYAPAEPQG